MCEVSIGNAEVVARVNSLHTGLAAFGTVPAFQTTTLQGKMGRKKAQVRYASTVPVCMELYWFALIVITIARCVPVML